MRRFSRLTAVLLGAVLTCAHPAKCAAAGEPEVANDSKPSAESLRESVAKLVGRLDTETRAARAEAEQKLLELGPDVLPHLPPPDLLPNVAVRETVRRIRLTLEREKARESVQASRVTLKGAFSLRGALERVEKQTGNRIDMATLPDEVLREKQHVEFEQTLFWKALDELTRAGDLRLDGSPEGIGLAPAGTVKEPVATAYSGPFRIAVKSAEVRPLVGRDDTDLLRFRLELIVEPRLRPLFLKFAADEIDALVRKIGALAPFSPDASYELPLGERGERIDLQLDYRIPADADVSRAALQGRAALLVAAGAEEITFADPERSKGAARRRGGVTVALQDARFRRAKDGNAATVQIAVSYDAGGPAFESHRTWIFHNRVWLQTPDGTRTAPEPDFTTRRQTDGAVVLVYQFENLQHDPDRYEFVYVAPTLLINVPVEIDLKEIRVTSGAQGK